ncbi:Glutamate-gated chloride channel [Sarcoptes scabiei]|uniref:Glutamate-gated chloride channel n=1 Tax=Sarcoptes scabiei TaxID=52283 RepID=A0A834R887_SARSC|nr:Glutamate-gated chloride channel [Sarcoptes scabiei]
MMKILQKFDSSFIWLFNTFSIILCQVNNFDRIGKHFNLTDQQFLTNLIENYDKNLRPAEKTNVNISILVLTISSPDESSVVYEIDFALMQKWNDPRLRFEVPSKLANENPDLVYLNGLKIVNQIWIPDIFFIKHGEFKFSTDKHDPILIALKIYPNGTIYYIVRRNMVLTCEGNLKIFPFDSPKCFFSIESLTQEKDQVQLFWDDAMPIKKSAFLKTTNAYLIRNLTSRCNKRLSWRPEFSCLSVLMVFSRDQSFYFTTVFVPGMVLVTSSFISFWLDINAVPARVMIGVTTMLNFCTTTNSFRSKLPVVCNLNAMNLWDFVCMFFIYASMIEFIIVNYIYRLGNSRSFKKGKHFKDGNNNISKNLRPPLNHTSSVNSLYESKTKNFYKQISLNNRVDQSDLSNRIKTATLRDINSDSNSFGILKPSNQTSIDDNTSRLNFFKLKSIFKEWIKKTNLISDDLLSNRLQLARSIDHISKTLFTLVFGLFTFFYFLTYAIIKPSQLDDWIQNEFEASD